MCCVGRACAYAAVGSHCSEFKPSLQDIVICYVVVVALFVTLCRGVPRIWQGGAKNFFSSDLEICMSRSDMLRMAKPCALLGGFGGMHPREIFLKWCNLVRFGVYFDQILSLKNFNNYHFLYKIFKNCIFLYKRINILDTRLLWGNYSLENICRKICDLCVLVCILK